MRNAFVCCTPFHVFVSIHLAENILSNQENDIFISDHFGSSKKLYSNLSKTNIFEGVYYVEDKNLSYDESFLKYKKTLALLKNSPEQIVADNELKMNYDQLYLFTHSYFSVLLTDFTKRTNPSVVINYVEEGKMTYLLSSSSKVNRMKNLINRFIKPFNRYLLNVNLADHIYLFKPDYYSGDLKVKVKEIPKIPRDNEFKNKINKIFEYEHQPHFKEKKIVFFDQSFTFDASANINEHVVIRDLLTKIDEAHMVVKLHPRDNIDKFNQLSKESVNNSNFPWEIIYLNEDVENKILVSVTSSALFTPNIMFNQNHILILLHKIYGLKDPTLDIFVEKLKYSGVPVNEPETLEEFAQIISNEGELHYETKKSASH